MIRLILELARRVQYLFRRERLDAELREEMETHAEMLARDNDFTSARQRMGNQTRWREISREAWGWSWLESLIRDVGYGGRLLVKSPGFTATACFSLAIGLGATIGIFGLINALMFKGLPVPHPHELWGLSHGNPQEHDDNFSIPDVRRAKPFQ